MPSTVWVQCTFFIEWTSPMGHGSAVCSLRHNILVGDVWWAILVLAQPPQVGLASLGQTPWCCKRWHQLNFSSPSTSNLQSQPPPPPPPPPLSPTTTPAHGLLPLPSLPQVRNTMTASAWTDGNWMLGCVGSATQWRGTKLTGASGTSTRSRQSSCGGDICE
eukprot:scaffold1970_cov114-Isochrysis_galbana.AAC.6